MPPDTGAAAAEQETSIATAFDRPSRWLAAVLAVMLISMILLLCMNVALRYGWGQAMLWADEALTFGLVVLTFLGAVCVSSRDQHLRMSLLTQTLRPKLSQYLVTGEHLLTIGVCAVVGYHSYQAVSRLYARGTRSNMADVPLWLIQAAVLVGLLGIALVSLAKLIRLIREAR